MLTFLAASKPFAACLSKNGSQAYRSVSFANGNALSLAKELGAVSKLALEVIIAADLAVNFQEINRSGGSRGFVA